MNRVTLFMVIYLGFGIGGMWYYAQEQPTPTLPALFFQDPTPRPTCDALDLVRVARAAILDPKNDVAKKQGLEMLDKCERIWTLLEKQLSARTLEAR